mgnify:CR=1 FL=1
MNLLFLTCEGGLTGNTRSTSYLARGLSDRGHNVFVGCPEESLLSELLANSDVRIIPISFRRKFHLPTMRKIRDLCRAENIQIINCQSSADRYNAIFAGWFYKLPAHVIHTRRQTPKSQGGAIQRAFYRRGTRSFVVVSEQLEETFVKRGYPGEHIKVIYNGIPAEFYESADDEVTRKLADQFGIAPNDRVVGSISRLKNQEQLVRAAKYLPPDIKLMFVGIERGIFDELAKELELENEIIYAGIVPPSEVVNYYRLFDLFVLPSTMDGFGLVLVEAMGLGVPVIGTRWEGIIDVLDGERNGLWFEDGDIRELAEKIRLVLSDEEICNRLVENGLKAARERFTVENTVDNYEEYFRSLIREG